MVGSAGAEIEMDPGCPLFDKVLVGGDLFMFYRYDSNPYFGAPLATTGKGESSYGEIAAKLRWAAVKNLGWTNFTLQTGAMFNSTLGADFYGLAENTASLDMELAYGKFEDLFESPFDLTVGMQDIRIEKWFLVGGTGRGKRSAIWTGVFDSYPFAVKLDQDGWPLKFSAFYAMADRYVHQLEFADPDITRLPFGKDDVSIAGINLHLDITAADPTPCLLGGERAPRFPFGETPCSNFYLYGGFYQKFDGDPVDLPAFTPRQQFLVSESDTSALDAGFDVTFGGLNLSGEFVYEFGNAGSIGDQDLDRDAFGGFAWARYTFDVPYKPFIGARYIYYSGDSNLEDDKAEDFDPMFNGFMGWGQWIMGELVGEAQLANTNKQVIVAELGCQPMENVKATFLYLHNTLNEPYIGVPGVGRFRLEDKSWADEFNLFFDVDVTKWLYVHVGLGYVTPNDAAEEVFGDNNDAFFTQVWLWFKF
jgi:hypothetical protein